VTQLGLQWPGYRLTDPRQFAILLARVTDLFGMAAARTPWWAYTWPLLAWAVLLMTPFVKGGLIDAVAGVATGSKGDHLSVINGSENGCD